MISDPVVRPKIVKAAGSSITAARRNHAISPEPGRTPGTGTPSNALASLKVIMQ
jgi:hypothetical protein